MCIPKKTIMKKNLLFLSLILFACQGKKDENNSIFIGTWKVIEMGKYEVSTCSGTINEDEFRGFKGKGGAIFLEIRDDGTGSEIITGPNESKTDFLWEEVSDLLCFKDACLKYEMAQNNRSFKVNTVEEAYCLDEDLKITEHTTRKSCEDATTSNEWVPKVCSMIRYKKEI